jgi:hypothetical protein
MDELNARAKCVWCEEEHREPDDCTG